MNQQLHIRTVGETGILVELDSLAHVMGLQTLLRQQNLPGVIGIVAAAETILISCNSPSAVRGVREFLAATDTQIQTPIPGTVHRLKTTYDGADLTDAARLSGLSSEALVAWHSGQQWLAAFGGFAPGFMYLAAAEHSLLVARLSTPRTVVPAGSVAVGGEFSAVYPGPTPGGWQLLGRCADILWDAGREQPALIEPGDAVEFMPVRELIEVGVAKPTVVTPRSHGPSGLQVLAAGVHTTVQDLGRQGYAHLGVPESGALDRAALRRANRMVGNGNLGAAGLEVVLSGLSFRAVGAHIVAVAGTSAVPFIADLHGDEREAPANAPFLLLDGETLTLRPLTLLPATRLKSTAGFRSYLAVRGGLDLPPVLGSRSTDVLSGLGPDPIAAGVFLPVAPAPAGSIVGAPEAALSPPLEVTNLKYLPGPRDDWFTPQSLAHFEAQIWEVGAQSNRIGLRLTGTPLQRSASAAGAELPSEGMANGAIQVPPSGLPMLFLADHPVTGGYPVLGVVLGEDLDKAAQLAPGARVRFSAI
ncbi:5-oxoprolinase/urea amidolyase family protein [Arthrobacter sp. TWP1-1]|uniref:5-oxoprolinase subunit B/C family protein n=1 Tax=Arthrobacter sp. TWP1-1 TaxID=2804568 RepID=UPI003CEAD47A